MAAGCREAEGEGGEGLLCRLKRQARRFTRIFGGEGFCLSIVGDRCWRNAMLYITSCADIGERDLSPRSVSCPPKQDE